MIKRLKEISGENDYFFGRSLDMVITKIRKYLKEDPALSIENVFGVGFIFNVPNNKVLHSFLNNSHSQSNRKQDQHYCYD